MLPKRRVKKFIKKLLLRGLTLAHNIWKINTAFAVSADAKMTGIFEV